MMVDGDTGLRVSSGRSSVLTRKHNALAGTNQVLVPELSTNRKLRSLPNRPSKGQELVGRAPVAKSEVTVCGMTIGIDHGDVWSHYCTLNEDGEVVGRGRFRTNPSGVEKWFTDLPPVRIAMEAGTHSIWISEQLQELGNSLSHSVDLPPRSR
jgi:hypothetical protein